MDGIYETMSKQETISSSDYQRLYGRAKAVVPIKSLKGRSSLNTPQVRDGIEFFKGGCKITLEGLIPGLNGKSGLIREPWYDRSKRKKAMAWRLKALNPTKFNGSVEIEFTVYASLLSDSDNLSSKRKIVYDCLVDLRVIENDTTDIIGNSLPKQEKCRRKDQRVTIKIVSI